MYGMSDFENAASIASANAYEAKDMARANDKTLAALASQVQALTERVAELEQKVRDLLAERGRG